MRRYVLFFILILMAGGCSPREPLEISLTGDRTVTASRGRNLTVRLEANPTTGYSWKVTGMDSDRILERTGPSRYDPDSDRIGSGGIESFFFTCIRPGREELVFEYERPWEEKEPVKRYLLEVR
ncbi:MAG: hypothetical protein GF392_00605, partial [Candidatus Omnitrophica bacterium]|nr:hypothetical protein [Candidatus Omnitrophota bacterium]